MIQKVLLFLFSVFCFSLLVSAQTPKNKAKTSADDSIVSNEFENEILVEVNRAREFPHKYWTKLKDRKRSFQGNVLKLPNRRPLLTQEGIKGVNDAIGYMKRQSRGEKLRFSIPLAKAARAQLKDLQKNPSLGHTGADGSDFNSRLSRIGVAGYASENISYYDLTPEQVVVSMLTDDGVPSRQHRRNILDKRFKILGAACGSGNDDRFICVLTFAEKFGKEKEKKIREY